MEVDLDLTKLKLFCDTVKNSSVLGSARHNSVTPSAVSHSIKNLEKLLGVPLSTHKRKKFELTDEGELVYEKSSNIFLAVRDLINALDLHKKQACRPLKFSSLVSISLCLFPRFLPKFMQDHPEARINCIFTGEIEQLKESLQQETSEIILSIHSPQLGTFESFPLYSGHFYLYHQKGEKSDPKEKGMLVENSTVATVKEFQRACLSQFDSTFPIISEINTWDIIAQFIQRSGGYGLLPDFIMWGGRYPDLVRYSPDTLAVPYKLSAYVKDKKQLSRSAEIFLEEITEFILTECAWRKK